MKLAATRGAFMAWSHTLFAALFLMVAELSFSFDA